MEREGASCSEVFWSPDSWDLPPAASLLTHAHKHVHTRTPGRETPTHAGRSNLDASPPPPPGRSLAALVHHPDAGARRSPSLVPLPTSPLSRRSGPSQSRGQRIHPLLLPPLGKAARLTHRIGQGHVAGPLLSQGLMHGESCPVALDTEAASLAPGSGRRAEHLTPWLRLWVPPRAEKDCLWLRGAAQVPLPPPSLLFCQSLLREAAALAVRAAACACARLPPPTPPTWHPHPSYPPPIFQSQTEAVFAPWGQGWAEKEGEATA